MKIKVIEHINTGKLYNYSPERMCFILDSNEPKTVEDIKFVHSPDFIRDFFIHTIYAKGSSISIGQKCEKIGRILNIDRSGCSFSITGSNGSGIVDKLSDFTSPLTSRGSFNFEISE